MKRFLSILLSALLLLGIFAPPAPGAVALRGTASTHSPANATTSFTITIPAAAAADDVLFLAVNSRDSTGAGSLSVADNDTGGNSWAKIGNSTDHKGTLWYKRATSGSASKTVTVSNTVGSASGVLKAFSGAETSGNPYTDVVVEDNASGDEGHAAFTPTNADSMVCAVVYNPDNITIASFAFVTLGALTNTHAESAGGLDSACDFGHALQSGGPSDTGGLGWTQTNLATKSITWAIKPPGGGGGPTYDAKRVTGAQLPF